jgi:DNA-directed RNA polymerase subunit H
MPRAKAKKAEEELPFKVTDHFLVPKHELMTKEEANETLKKFNATADQFPFILSTDPAAKSIGAHPGDFIRVSRKSETAGEMTYYRYVVEA